MGEQLNRDLWTFGRALLIAVLLVAGLLWLTIKYDVDDNRQQPPRLTKERPR